MPNVKMLIEYDGSKFSGWQKQPNQRTIQSELEKALQIALRQDIKYLFASGRTDAGVHAKGQVVNFHVKEVGDLERLKHSVSSILKNELAVLHVELVPDDFNSCFRAKSKMYQYTILYRAAPAVLDYGKVWHISSPLNVELMRTSAQVLVGKHDFQSFRASGCGAKSSIREIYESELIINGDYLIYNVVGNGFLKQMVRNIVGTLVEIGKGTRTKSMADILAAKNRQEAGVTAPAHGLALMSVYY